MATASMKRVRRVFVILLPVLLLVAAGVWWFSRPDYVVFSQGLRPADASAVVAELEKRATPYRLEGEGGTILVPADRVADLRLAVGGSGGRGVVGFEMFNESDMGVTNFAQKINYQRALQGELTRTVLMMDGVENARIHLALPEKALFRGERTEASAAVAIAMRPGAVLDPVRVAGIQRLVSAAAIDLPEARVVVLDGAGRPISTPRSTADTTGTPDARQAIASLLAARANDAIAAALPGRGGDRVTVRIAQDGPVDWDGGERSFALDARVSTVASPGEDERRRIVDAVNAALAIDPTRGDSVTVEPAASDPVTPRPPILASPAAVDVAGLADPVVASGSAWPWIGALAAFAVLVLIAVVRGRRPSLDPDAQDAFANRLRDAMEMADVRA